MAKLPQAHGAGRYAPSPSGDLHVGNLRTALLAWLFARSTGRAFLMRVEDLDRARDAGSATRQLEDLASLGIDWDGDVVLQTERDTDHQAAIEALRANGLVYECTCTRKDILAAPTAPHAPPGAYPGACRNLTETQRAEARERIHPRRPALRLRVPEGAHAPVFTDLVLGEFHGDIDDFVLRRGDGAVAYNLAVVVDDASMGVNQIVRGDDLAASTPRQILLQRLLELPSPPVLEYAHVPLVLGPTGARLAKRDGAVTMRELVAQGVEASDVRGALARSIGLAARHERPSMAELLGRFDPTAIPRSPWVWSAESFG